MFEREVIEPLQKISGWKEKDTRTITEINREIETQMAGMEWRERVEKIITLIRERMARGTPKINKGLTAGEA